MDLMPFCGEISFYEKQYEQAIAGARRAAIQGDAEAVFTLLEDALHYREVAETLRLQKCPIMVQGTL